MKRWLLGFACAAGLACSNAGTPELVFTTGEISFNPAPANTTSVHQLQDLEAALDLHAPAGEHKVTWLVTMPEGTVFLRRDDKVVVGSTHEVALSLQLPIYGTSIDHAGLSGRWSVSVTVDGHPITSNSYELTK